MLRALPWRSVPTNDEHGNAFPIMKKAYKRAITKARWDALNEEYLVYKQPFVDEVAHAEPETHRLDQGAPDHERSEPTARPHPHPQAQTQTQTQTTPSSSYSFDYLVFVRNVGTNKTTLKSLFTQAFQDQDGSGQGQECAHTPTTAGLDYVEFSTWMDTVCIRSHPSPFFFSQD